jgi:hypothetical protein
MKKVSVFLACLSLASLCFAGGEQSGTPSGGGVPVLAALPRQDIPLLPTVR